MITSVRSSQPKVDGAYNFLPLCNRFFSVHLEAHEHHPHSYVLTPCLLNNYCSAQTRAHLEQDANSRLDPSLWTLGTSLSLHLSNACTSLLVRDALAGDELALTLTHAAVDIDVLCLDVPWTVLGDIDPRVCLPEDIEEEDDRACKIRLEEALGVKVGTADWV